MPSRPKPKVGARAAQPRDHKIDAGPSIRAISIPRSVACAQFGARASPWRGAQAPSRRSRRRILGRVVNPPIDERDDRSESFNSTAVSSKVVDAAGRSSHRSRDERTRNQSLRQAKASVVD
jgi:hypothetical protein